MKVMRRVEDYLINFSVKQMSNIPKERPFDFYGDGGRQEDLKIIIRTAIRTENR